MDRAARGRSATRAVVPPEAAFFVGAVSQYLGAAVAVELFDRMDPAGVAFFRVASAGLVLVVLRRSWRRSWSRADLAWTAAFGVALAGMNTSIYFAFDRLPLGNAVAIEFLGPIAVAAFGARTRRTFAALGLAVVGVALLAQVTPEGSASGVLFALAAGTFWAGYIVLGHQVAQRGLRVDGLGLGMLIGALAISPVAGPSLRPALDSPSILLLAMATGVLSNVIPYTIDQVVLGHVSRDRFAFLQSMLPATAVLVGLVALAQTPSLPEVAGIAVVIAAIVLRGRSDG